MRRGDLRHHRHGGAGNHRGPSRRSRRRAADGNLFQVLPGILRPGLKPIPAGLVRRGAAAADWGADRGHEQRHRAGAVNRARRQGAHRCAGDRQAGGGVVRAQRRAGAGAGSGGSPPLFPGDVRRGLDDPCPPLAGSHVHCARRQHDGAPRRLPGWREWRRGPVSRRRLPGHAIAERRLAQRA